MRSYCGPDVCRIRENTESSCQRQLLAVFIEQVLNLHKVTIPQPVRVGYSVCSVLAPEELRGETVEDADPGE